MRQSIINRNNEQSTFFKNIIQAGLDDAKKGLGDNNFHFSESSSSEYDYSLNFKESFPNYNKNSRK